MTQGRLNHYQKRWAAEKYLVMAHSQAHYNALRLLFKGNQWSEEKELEFERLLKEAYRATPTTKTLRTAYQHIWGYFKKRATSPEKDRYKELDESLETKSADMNQFLKELTQKYQPAYLIQSRIMQLDASDLK
ncbi:YbgA family protein [Streptococcus sp.]|uniref:YbgA family protein n=1 Tax=Streptococcus sp. TaxID=1306 RepID=UPI00391CF72F